MHSNGNQFFRFSLIFNYYVFEWILGQNYYVFRTNLLIFHSKALVSISCDSQQIQT